MLHDPCSYGLFNYRLTNVGHYIQREVQSEIVLQAQTYVNYCTHCCSALVRTKGGNGEMLFPCNLEEDLSTFADIRSLVVSIEEETYFMIDTRVTRMVNHCPSCLEEYSSQTVCTKGASGLIQLERRSIRIQP